MRNQRSFISAGYGPLILLLTLTLLLAVAPAQAANVGRQAYLPVTFDPEGWHDFCDPNNGIIPGGVVYNRFSIAFSCFQFYGTTKPNQLLVGNQRYYIKYIGKTSCLQRLCMLMGSPGDGGVKPNQAVNECGRLLLRLECPWNYYTADGVFVGGGDLATQTIALLLNVAYNDMRVMPRTPGVDLECYILSSGYFKGKTVAEVFNIANRVLAGESPIRFGVSCLQLVGTLNQINSNYEFVNYNTYIDNGFLIPNEPFGPPAPPHCPTVPMECNPPT